VSILSQPIHSIIGIFFGFTVKGIFTVVLYVDRYVYAFRRGYISMAVMGDASDTIEYDRRTPKLFKAPLQMKQDTLHQCIENTLEPTPRLTTYDIDLPAVISTQIRIRCEIYR